MSEPRLKKPAWLKTRVPSGDEFRAIHDLIRAHGLVTVCQEARCPNINECWNNKCATLMILGKICTRACRFCAVKTGDPAGHIDMDEPRRVAELVKEMDLKYVVITSVDRDDLEDGGSQLYAETISMIKDLKKDIKVEALIPDFQDRINDIERVVLSTPFILGHNVETVENLTPVIRDRRSNYQQSLNLLASVKEIKPDQMTKSGFMVGMGEGLDEIKSTMRDLVKNRVDIITIGQYLQPTRKHYPVKKYYSPEEFEIFEKIGYDMGFKKVVSGPLVRSSYHASSVI
ncbi:lipoyl synthase [candidate division WOR-3 bacterium RBG_13_43_14]|uniref:Lipoyl synthase n=1 Tax=candidate division WOR-3 bacterium RBG_13_43_14 TaxID=1802590 RepID=A0A1F4UC43_UNCW3|nr:MAG: lipoyl synthase [candidate division WOR-3 bacterium RBG_13_43_14]